MPVAARTPTSPLATGAAVAALALLAYANTLSHGFVWDDAISVQRWLPALPSAASAFLPPENIPQFPPDYYRPLQLLSYRFDRAVGGGAAWPFHLTVVCLHALASVLVWRTGARLLDGSRDRWPALAAAVLFAVHPIHCESVAWMAARPDVMVTCAGLVALLAYWHAGWNEWRRSAAAAAFVLVALLCKENAAALLIAVPASLVILRAPPGPAAANGPGRIVWALPAAPTAPAALLPFTAAAVSYLLLRRAGLHGSLLGAFAPSHLPAALVGAAGTYLRLLVIPYPQDAYIADLPEGEAALALNLLTLLAFAACLWWAWRRADRVLVFALGWIAITLAPSFAVLAKSGTAPIAERYLYLPSVGLCWAAGAIVARVRERRRVVACVVAAALAVASLAITVRRNRVWRDNYSLWSDTAAKNAVDGMPLRSLAAATLERGDAATAERLFLEALERRNTPQGRRLIYNNLGTIALGRGDDVAAERYYRQSLALGATADCLYNLGLIALERARSPQLAGDEEARAARNREARAFFEQALDGSPHDAESHVGLGYAAQALGDAATARRQFEQGLALGLPAASEEQVRRLLETLN